MKKAITDMFYIGLGAARITREKVEETVKAFAKKRIINNKQAKEIVNKVMAEAGKARDRLVKEGKKEFKSLEGRVKSAGKRAAKTVSKGISRASRRIAKSGMKI